MEVRVEGRGLEVHCRHGTSRRFLCDFFCFCFHDMAWHGTGLRAGFGIIGRGVFFGSRDPLMTISSYRGFCFITLLRCSLCVFFFSILGRFFLEDSYDLSSVLMMKDGRCSCLDSRQNDNATR